jgi:predicted metal-dependent hydrolase
MMRVLFEQLSLFGQDAPFNPPPADARTRQIHLGQRIVAYTLHQGRGRRRLALNIDERGLRVSAPRHVRLAEIEAFMQQNAVWIVDKLALHADRQVQRHQTVRDGVHLPLLGGVVEVRIGAGNNRGRWQEDTLWLDVRAGSTPADHARLAVRALQQLALAVFGERLALHAQAMGLPLPLLRLSAARTRWGSCSLKTGIRLNWRLIHLPLPLVDYVVIHELAHLVEMNHSPRFWAVVAAHCPDWAQVRQELKLRGREIPLL